MCKKKDPKCYEVDLCDGIHFMLFNNQDVIEHEHQAFATLGYKRNEQKGRNIPLSSPRPTLK